MIYIVWRCPKCGQIQISWLKSVGTKTKLKCKRCGAVTKLYGRYGFRVNVFKIDTDYNRVVATYKWAIDKLVRQKHENR